jgi:opacity protein-like surface antigen
MRKKVRLVMLVGALVLGAPIARAGDISLTVLGGAAIPTGDFADESVYDAKIGFQFGGSLDYMLNDVWAIGVDGSFVKNKSDFEGDTLDLGDGDTEKVEKAEYSIIQFGVHGKYLFPTQGKLRPYAIVGVGMSKPRYEESGQDTIGGVADPYSFEIEGDARFSAKVGLGTSWSLAENLAFGIEANYNYLSQEVSSIHYIGVTGGITLRFPTGGTAGATSP